jgi:hypothetical protein
MIRLFEILCFIDLKAMKHGGYLFGEKLPLLVEMSTTYVQVISVAALNPAQSNILPKRSVKKDNSLIASAHSNGFKLSIQASIYNIDIILSQTKRPCKS